MGALIRLLFTSILLLVAACAGYYYGYRAGSGGRSPSLWPGGAISTLEREVTPDTGTLGKRVTDAGREASGFLSDAALTTKIKSKMSLDDYVEAGNVHVSTKQGVVTLTGSVRSSAERARAVTLARDTKGVTSVVDRLQVERQ